MSGFPYWLLLAVLSFGAALAYPWAIYFALFSMVMVFLCLFIYMGYCLFGKVPLPTPIQRALGREEHKD